MVIKFHFPDTFFNKKVFIRLGSRILDKKIIQLFNYGWKKKKSDAGKSNSGMSTTCHLCQIIKPNLSINAQQH